MKSYFPELEVYALDLTLDFQKERVLKGVHIAPYSIEQIEKIVANHQGRGLLHSSGTLMYYRQEELDAFIAFAASKNLDVALCEPGCVQGTPPQGTPPRKSWKRSALSYYHNYPKRLLNNGYVLPDAEVFEGRNISHTLDVWKHIQALRA